MGVISDDDELLDLVDEAERVVGTITHAEAFDPANLQGNYLRAADCFIINSRGELWVPRRTATKKIAPNGLDYSAGEHAQAGESYIDAIVRGFAEELNIAANPEDFTYIGKLRPRPGDIPYFEALYLYYSDVVPHYNTDDYVDYEWLTPEALLQKLRSGVPAKKMLPNVELVSAYVAEHQGDH